MNPETDYWIEEVKNWTVSEQGRPQTHRMYRVQWMNKPGDPHSSIHNLNLNHLGLAREDILQLKDDEQASTEYRRFGWITVRGMPLGTFFPKV